MEEKNNGNLWRTEKVAQYIGKSVRRVQQLTQEGIISTVKVKEDGKTVRRYDISHTLRDYIFYLDAELKKKQDQCADKETVAGKLDAEKRLKEAKAELAEIDLKEKHGEMHRSEDVEKIMTQHVFAVRSMLLSLPNRLAVDAAGANTKAEAADVIKRGVYDILNQLSDLAYDKTDYQKLVRERQGWEEYDFDDFDQEDSE
ncbi:MAG: hypothetical protein ACLU5E_01345 [Anaerovoracaceae bacterium]